tara:strand:- start:189 stop:365 length:177 start_codon:yes stop_codon:yes gene_type:complete
VGLWVGEGDGLWVGEGDGLWVGEGDGLWVGGDVEKITVGLFVLQEDLHVAIYEVLPPF